MDLVLNCTERKQEHPASGQKTSEQVECDSNGLFRDSGRCKTTSRPFHPRSIPGSVGDRLSLEHKKVRISAGGPDVQEVRSLKVIRSGRAGAYQG